MHDEIKQLVTAYNEAVDSYHLARLEYACAYDAVAIPPVARQMPVDGLERAEQHRPATLSVQAVRDFFEDVFDGAILANMSGAPYESLHEASLDLTRRFFQVSLTRMGISCRGMLD
jgi:hypothetical protein